MACPSWKRCVSGDKNYVKLAFPTVYIGTCDFFRSVYAIPGVLSNAKQNDSIEDGRQEYDIHPHPRPGQVLPKSYPSRIQVLPTRIQKRSGL